eukprot:scaffold3155_cov97-Skeletonema_dohrnii-CCMP3373.AAC.15
MPALDALWPLRGDGDKHTLLDIKPPLLKLCSCSLQTSTIIVLPPYVPWQEILLFTSFSID